MKKYVLQITDEEMRDYGEFFQQMRESVGLTRQQMADELGVFRTTIRRWESGKTVPQRDINEIVEDVRCVVKKYKRTTA